jgi:HSP20 family molecular chaperone IbpA
MAARPGAATTPSLTIGVAAAAFTSERRKVICGILAPRIDVAEDGQSVTLTAELPGVSENDIDVSIVGDQLTIKGEKRSEHEDKKESEGFAVHRRERSYGAFQRTITIPYQIDPPHNAEF